MRTRRRATTEDLRLAIDSLPRHTKVAMLEGIRCNDIIAGAYSDKNGICPMLAAHRAGGRTCCISFARAWDRFAFRDSRRPAARRATERELLVLRSHLETSLLDEEGPAPARTPGQSRIRITRRYDEYQRALQRLESAQPQPDRELLTR